MRIRDDKGRYIAGHDGSDRVTPTGTVRIRTRYKRDGEQRAYIKIDENKWVLRARYVWEQAHGPIPRGMGVHHKDRDKLNDTLDNLELVSKTEHIALHRDEYQERITEGLTRLRRERRWSTKSKTKRTGRPPTYSAEQMQRAIGIYLATDRTMADIAAEYSIPIDSFRAKIAIVKKALAD